MTDRAGARGVGDLEGEIREFVVNGMPMQSAPNALRMAFHDAASFDPDLHTGGETGAIRFPEELARHENDSFVNTVERLKKAKARFPGVSWADLVAVAGAAAVEKCGGPLIEVGLGRVEAEGPVPYYALPSEFTDMAVIKREFARRGFGPRDLVALTGAHTIGGRVGGPSFTRDDRAFTNSYFVRLEQYARGEEDPSLTLLASDKALVDDPDLKPHVERYAKDEAAFLEDFSAAFVKITWLGQTREP